MSLTPTVLSLRYLRAEGWLVEVVERWIPGANIRKDLFDIVDLIAIKAGETLAVQTTTASNMSARMRKIAECENTPIMREAEWSIHCHGWSKKDGKWVVKVVDLS